MATVIASLLLLLLHPHLRSPWHGLMNKYRAEQIEQQQQQQSEQYASHNEVHSSIEGGQGGWGREVWQRQRQGWAGRGCKYIKFTKQFTTAAWIKRGT